MIRRVSSKPDGALFPAERSPAPRLPTRLRHWAVLEADRSSSPAKLWPVSSSLGFSPSLEGLPAVCPSPWALYCCSVPSRRAPRRRGEDRHSSLPSSPVLSCHRGVIVARTWSKEARGNNIIFLFFSFLFSIETILESPEFRISVSICASDQAQVWK